VRLFGTISQRNKWAALGPGEKNWSPEVHGIALDTV
jgi:hypothetical protein